MSADPEATTFDEFRAKVEANDGPMRLSLYAVTLLDDVKPRLARQIVADRADHLSDTAESVEAFFGYVEDRWDRPEYQGPVDEPI